MAKIPCFSTISWHLTRIFRCDAPRLTHCHPRRKLYAQRRLSMIPPFSGRCLCGETSYACKAEPLWQAHCHCESCRRATSSPFTSYFAMADGKWLWTGQPPATYGSSPGVWRDRCATCGAPMAYRSSRFPGEIHFFAATLDDPTRYSPTIHVHTAEMLPWVHLTDGLPQK